MSEQETVSPAAQEPKTEPIVIKRYTNRKLYDTVESRYVTLDEIAEMIKRGSEVKVIDNRSKEDLTSVTLAQIIFEEEKKKSHMPLGVLRAIIRSGTDSVSGFIDERRERLTEVAGGVVGKVSSLRDGAGERIGRLFKRDGRPEVSELLANAQRSLEDFQKRIDEGVRSAVDQVGAWPGVPQLKGEIAKLTEKLHELQKKIDELK